MSQQQQQAGFVESWKRKTNTAYFFATIHQRAIIVPFRKCFGTEALGTPCALAVVMMFLWWMFSRDELMMWWMVFWAVCFVVRRAESLRLSSKIHSRFDGLTINLGKNDRLAKMIFEPALIGLLAFAVTKFYELQGWPLYGLPWFLWIGVISLPFVVSVDQTMWDKRLQAMNDGQIENEAATRDFKDKYGH